MRYDKQIVGHIVGNADSTAVLPYGAALIALGVDAAAYDAADEDTRMRLVEPCVTEALRTADPVRDKALAAIVTRDHEIVMSEIAIALVGSRGISTVLAAALCMLAADTGYLLTGDRLHIDMAVHWGDRRRVCSIMTDVGLAPGVRAEMTAEGDLTIVQRSPLPETVLTAALGRPLAEIAPHPVLDAYPLVINGHRIDDEDEQRIEMSGAGGTRTLREDGSWA